MILWGEHDSYTLRVRAHAACRLLAMRSEAALAFFTSCHIALLRIRHAGTP